MSEILPATTAPVTETAPETAAKMKTVMGTEEGMKRSMGEYEKSRERYYGLVTRGTVRALAHQRDGIEWCIRQELRLNGNAMASGFVADEMGLGKTVVLSSIVYARPLTRTLVVVPRAMAGQMANDIARFTNHEMKPILYYANFRQMNRGARLMNASVVVTTYSALSSKAFTSGRDPVMSMKWDRIMYDEAHYLKSNKTKRFECVTKRLKAAHVWCFSGTPVQNHSRELVALYSLIGVERKANTGAGAGAGTTEAENGVGKFDTTDWLSSCNAQYMLRRTKETVSTMYAAAAGVQAVSDDNFVMEAMPELVRKVHRVPFADENHAYCARHIHMLMKRNQELLDSNRADAKAVKSEEPHWYASFTKRGSGLVTFMRGRQICNVPDSVADAVESYQQEAKMKQRGAIPPLPARAAAVVVVPVPEQGPAAAACVVAEAAATGNVEAVPTAVAVPVAAEENAMLLQDYIREVQHNEADATRMDGAALRRVSPKLERMARHIAQNETPLGKLVFCQYSRELVVLKEMLANCGVHDVGEYSGRCNDPAVFARKHKVLLLQVQMACEGLNLQHDYSEVYFVSPHPNPAVEDQAIGRCYRIGQKHTVVVHYFLMDFEPFTLPRVPPETDAEPVPVSNAEPESEWVEVKLRTVDEMIVEDIQAQKRKKMEILLKSAIENPQLRSVLIGCVV